MTKKKEQLYQIAINDAAYEILHDWILGDQTLSEAIISADKRLKKFRNRP